MTCQTCCVLKCCFRLCRWLCRTAVTSRFWVWSSRMKDSTSVWLKTRQAAPRRWLSCCSENQVGSPAHHVSDRCSSSTHEHQSSQELLISAMTSLPPTTSFVRLFCDCSLFTSCLASIHFLVASQESSNISFYLVNNAK